MKHSLNPKRNLEIVFKLTQDWLIKFDINKCVVMPNNEKGHYFIDGRQLDDYDCEKILFVLQTVNILYSYLHYNENSLLRTKTVVADVYPFSI